MQLYSYFILAGLVRKNIESLSRDLLSKTSWLTFSFKDPEVEESYRRQRETFSGAATTGIPLVLLSITAARILMDVK